MPFSKQMNMLGAYKAANMRKRKREEKIQARRLEEETNDTV
jgi:hypothetical protein